MKSWHNATALGFGLAVFCLGWSSGYAQELQDRNNRSRVFDRRDGRGPGASVPGSPVTPQAAPPTEASAPQPGVQITPPQLTPEQIAQRREARRAARGNRAGGGGGAAAPGVNPGAPQPGQPAGNAPTQIGGAGGRGGATAFTIQGKLPEISSGFAESLRTRRTDFDREKLQKQPNVILLGPRRWNPNRPGTDSGARRGVDARPL